MFKTIFVFSNKCILQQPELAQMSDCEHFSGCFRGFMKPALKSWIIFNAENYTKFHQNI